MIKIFNKETIDVKNDDLLIFTLKICNQNENLIQLQLKFQLEFIQAKKIYVNFFDMSLNEVCNKKKPGNNKILNVISTKSSFIAQKIDELNSTISSSSSISSSSNIKIHILLPVMLSSLFVASLVLLVIFLKRLYQRRAKNVDVTCKNKFGKFF